MKIVGCDVGGTHTDLIVIDTDEAPDEAELRLAKIGTVPGPEWLGMLRALERAGVPAAGIGQFVFGTRAGDPRPQRLEGAPEAAPPAAAGAGMLGGRIGWILTRQAGESAPAALPDEDTLLGPDGFDDGASGDTPAAEEPAHSAAAEASAEGADTEIVLQEKVAERIGDGGQVIQPIDGGEVMGAISRLSQRGATAICVALDHADLNPVHEAMVAEVAAKLFPEMPILLSHRLSSSATGPERHADLERHARAAPLIDQHVVALRRALSERRFTGSLLMMTQNGGAVVAERARDGAAAALRGGRAASVVAAAYTAHAAGFTDLVCCDIGGSSAGLALILDGEPVFADRRDPSDDAMPASPRVDWRRVGAGAGSVVFLDRNGQLAVGMEGAGASPGPIVFGRAGDRPTVTDAQVILGRLDPQLLTAVEAPLTQAALRALFERGIARPLRQEPETLAAAILGLFEARLVAGIRLLCAEQQKEPKDLALFASGGAGAMHATAIARELGIRKVLVPARPGLTRALGCLVADLRQDFVQPLDVPLGEFDLDGAEAALDRQAAQGRAALAPRGNGSGAGFGIETVEVEHAVMLQIEGEPRPRRVVQAESRPRLSSLHAELEQLRSLRRKGPEPVARVVGLRTAVIGRRPALQLMGLMAPQQRKATLEDAKIGVRPVWFGSGFVQCPVYRREAIPITAGFIGPAIIEQMDATVVIDPLMHVSADEQGNLVVHVR